MKGGYAQKPKVLYLSPNGYLGGAERFVLEVNKGHQASGKITSTILFFSNGPAAEMAKNFGIPCFILKNSFRLSRPLQLWRACCEIRSLIKSHKFQVIHATMAYAHIVCFLSTLFLPVKRVWFQHGPLGSIFDRIANFLPRDVVLFNSNFTLEEHHKLGPGIETTGGEYVINLGIPSLPVDDQKVLSIRSSYLDKSKKYLLVCAGRISAWKGYETAIQALSYLHETHPTAVASCQLLVIGDAGMAEDETYHAKLKELVKTKKMEELVTFLPHQADIQNYFVAADLFIHTSKIPEPFGLVVAEAMKLGTLVIGSDSGGVADILKNAQTGFNFGATGSQAPKQLSAILLKLFPLFEENSNELQRIRMRAKKLIDQDYALGKMVESLEKIY
jgi:glycosyltransferase involved in cell wall biosynthesis